MCTFKPEGEDVMAQPKQGEPCREDEKYALDQMCMEKQEKKDRKTLNRSFPNPKQNYNHKAFARTPIRRTGRGR